MQSGGQAAGIQLQVGLDLAYFRTQMQKVSSIASSEFTGRLDVRFNKNTLDAELNNLQKAIKRRVYRVEIGGNIDTLPDKVKKLRNGLAALESVKIDLGVGAVKSLSKKDASKINSELRAQVLGEQKKIYVPVSIKPSIVKKDVLDFKNAVQSKLSGITVKVKADLEAASISGGAKSRADINADVRRKLQEISEIGAQRMSGVGGDVTEAARRAQLKRSLETGGFDIGGLKDIGKQLGIANAGRYKNANSLINKIVADASIEMVKKYLDPQAVMRNSDRSGLSKVLDTFARGVFNMLGIDPTSIRAQQQASKPKPFAPAGLLPSFTLKGAKEEMMRQLTAGISPTASSGGGRDGKLAMTGASLQERLNNMEVQSVKVREVFDPREFESATLRFFRVIGNALESISNQAQSASSQAENSRIDQSVAALMQSIDNAVKVARAKIGNVSNLLSGKVEVRDLGRTVQSALPPTRIAGFLPPAVGRAPNVYSTGGESQSELFARREREARMRSLFGSEPQLMLPPARPRGLGAPPLYQAPSLPHSNESAYLGGRTGSSVKTRTPGGFIGGMDGPPGGGAEANAFIDASRNALAYSQALTGLRESVKGVQAGQLPLVGGIKELAGEFGQATKQVLLYGTAYKGLAFLTSLPGEAFNAAKALGTYKNQLQAVTSATGTFSNSLAFVDNLAQRFNVPLESAREGFVKLYASMQPAGFSQKQIEGLFTGVSQATAAFGLSADKVDRVNYAFAQMASKGQIMSEELKGQLGDVLPGALSLFAEAAKMSIPEFSKAMEDGAFKGDAMMQVLENVGILMKVKFGAAAAGAAKTLQGALNGIQNNLKLMYEAFGPVINRMAAVFGPQVTSLIKNVTDVIKAFELGISTTGDSFAVMAPQAQGFYSAIQSVLPSIQALVPSFIAAAQNVGYFASSIATAAQPLFGLLKLALDFISIPFVARVAVYATIVGTLTSAFTLLKNTGIIQATVAMIRFMATLTVAQLQVWLFNIRLAIASLVTMVRTANLARLSLMALRVALVSFGVGAVLIGLDFVAQKLLNIGSAADDAKKRTAALTDELARAVETGNVALTSQKYVEEETKAQSLAKSKQILGRFQGGFQQGASITKQEYEQLQRAGLATGINFNERKGRATATGGQIAENLKTAQAGYVEALNASGSAQEALKDSIQVQGNMQRELHAHRSQMKDIPPATGVDGTGTDTAAQDAARLASQQQQNAIDAANRQNALNQAITEGMMTLDDQAFQHRINLIDARNNYELAGLNSIEARQEKFQQDLQKIELDRINTVRKAQQEVQKASLQYAAAQNTAAAAVGGGGSIGTGVARLPGSNTGRLDASGQNGADMPVALGNIMRSYHNGIVTEIDRAGNNGNYVVIEFLDDLGRKLEATYSHVAAAVKVGQQVVGGQTIGRFDASGRTFGAHNSVDINTPGTNGALQRNRESAAARRSADILVTGRVQGRPSSAANTMQRREDKAGGKLGVEQQQLLNEQTEAGRIAMMAANEALAQRKALIASNINTIFPVAEQRLENDLMKIRNQLQLQGMPQEYIEYQESTYKGAYESAQAIAKLKEETVAYGSKRDALQAQQAKGIALTQQESVDLKSYTEAIKQNDDAVVELTEKQKQYQIVQLEGALATMKNADALKAQQETMSLIKGSVESASSSYKGFMKEIAMGGDPSEALKKFQEAITDQVLTVFFDFAMKPVEDFFKNQLSAMFGVETEESARQKAIATAEEQLNVARGIAADVKTIATAPVQGQAVTDAGGFPIAAPGGIVASATEAAMNGAALPVDAAALAGTTNPVSAWGDSLNAQVSESLTKATETTKTEGNALGENLGKAVGAVGMAAGAAMGIVAGISQIKEGSTSGVLGGIGSIFMSLGGAIGGFAGMFKGANGGVAAGGWKPFPVRAFANGGMVSGPTLGLVGEGKYNEAIVPLPDGKSIPVQMRGGGGGLREAMNGNSGRTGSSPILNMSFQSTNINGVEYVSRDQLEQAMAATRRQAASDGAKRGMSMTLDKLQQSPSTRSRLGMGGR